MEKKRVEEKKKEGKAQKSSRILSEEEKLEKGKSQGEKWFATLPMHFNFSSVGASKKEREKRKTHKKKGGRDVKSPCRVRFP